MMGVSSSNIRWLRKYLKPRSCLVQAWKTSQVCDSSSSTDLSLLIRKGLCTIYLLLYASVLLTTSLLGILLQQRGVCEDTQDNQLVYNDGPTANWTAGIGTEFESPFFKLEHKTCSLEDTNAAKISISSKGAKGRIGN